MNRSPALLGFLCACLAAASTTLAQPGAGAPLRHPFFAMDTGTRDAPHQTPEAQARMLKELGYDGIGWSPTQVPEMLAALDREGLKMFNVYIGVDIDGTNRVAPEPILKLISQLKDRDVALWLYVTSKKYPKPSDPAGDEDAVTMLRDIADRAQAANLKVALYPHTFFWMERVQDAVRLARKVDRKNLGVTFNLCHCLKVGDEAKIPGLLEEAMPHLMFVTINGADHSGDWDRLIQPLGRGAFDVGSVLKVLRRLRYEGPIGLQHYGIKGDAHTNLQQSMNGWRHLNASTTADPPRLKRADSFLGIHFDFHAGDDCTEIGKNTTRAMIENIIGQVRPDYLQIDCKGHRGLSSYPTKIGHQAPGFVGDPLRLWRQVTAEHGVALYMHYSGVWDSEAIRKHPDWAVINADGATNGNATSFFSAYADQLLIPQLRELSGDYGVDGVWVDGECWASMPDFGAAARQAFEHATGAKTPLKRGEPQWYEFLQFNREAYRRYLRHYIAEVKRTHPEMQICSNWAFTDHMPEAVCAPVDWLSGDYSPEDSVNSARLSARYLARQGKPWDLMAWSFTTKPGKGGANRKSAVQLQREAAVVLALGGGFQAYFTQRRDGSVREEELPVMAEVAQFCRERQPFCHRATPVPQVALLYSTAAHYRDINGLFNRDLSRIRGTLQALLEIQHSVEVLSEHNLSGRMAEYPLIVVPEIDYLEPAFKEELIAYVKGGGNLLLIGPGTAALFPAQLGITFDGAPQTETRFLAQGSRFTPTRDATRAVRIDKGEPLGRLHLKPDANADSQPAASLAPLGQGRIAATYFSLSRGYIADRSETTRAFLGDLVHRLFPTPIVHVTGSPDVDVAVSRPNGRLTMNLVNTAGPHADANSPIHDAIPPVGPLELRIRAERKPDKIILEPGAQILDFDYRDGEARLTVPRLEIHSVVVVH